MTGWLMVIGTLLAAPLGTAHAVGVRATSPTQRGVVATVPAASASRPALPAPTADRWIAEDKARHFALSFAATSMVYGGARLGLDPAPGRRTAAGVALLLGVGKELLDVRGGGPFSFKDLVWDAAGVALGTLLALQIR